MASRPCADSPARATESDACGPGLPLSVHINMSVCQRGGGTCPEIPAAEGRLSETVQESACEAKR